MFCSNPFVLIFCRMFQPFQFRLQPFFSLLSPSTSPSLTHCLVFLFIVTILMDQRWASGKNKCWNMLFHLFFLLFSSRIEKILVSVFWTNLHTILFFLSLSLGSLFSFNKKNWKKCFEVENRRKILWNGI